MAHPEILQKYPQAEVPRLEKFLSRLALGKAAQRKEILRQAQSYIFSRPSIAISSAFYLSEHPGRNSQELLSCLQEPEKIIEFIAANGKTLSKKTDFQEVFDFLDSPGSEIVLPMLIGHLSQPTRILKKNKKEIESQKKISKRATSLALNFAQMLYETTDPTTKQLALNAFVRHLEGTPKNENNLVDFLLATASYGQDEKEAATAEAVLKYIDISIKKEFDVNILDNYPTTNIVPKFDDKDVDQIKVGYGVHVPILSKQPNLTGIWGRIEKRNIHAYERAMKLSLEQAAAYVHRGNTDKEILIIDLAEPLLFDFSTEAYKNFFERIGQMMADKYGHNYMIIPSPQGRLIFISGPSDELSRISHSLELQLNTIIRSHVSTVDANKVRHIHQDEINTVLEFMRPFEIDDKKIAKELPRLIQEAEGGLHAISARGIKSLITLENESFIRDMGLNEIFFRQEKEGIRVITRWNNGDFTFLVDRDYQSKGLDSLSDTNKNWLLTIVFSYLRAIKNRGEEKVKFLGEETQLEVPEDDSFPEKGETRKQMSRDPHLRVLALGHYSHEIGLEQFDPEVRFHYGIGLGVLNSFFIAIQENQAQLTDPNSYVNQQLDQMPYGQSIRLLLQNIFNRAENKISKPRWVKGTLAGEQVLQFRPTVKPPEYDPKTQFYMVTFIRETVRADAQPREVNCPGVAEKIISLTQLKI